LRILFSLLTISLALLVVACNAEPPRRSLLAVTLAASDAQPTPDLSDPLIAEGRAQYDLVCAHCHGYNLEGQLADTLADTRALGMNTVPAPGATGHFWQHPDQLLIRVVQEGIQNPLDQFPMAAFGADLSEDQIRAILAYIKTSWTDEQRTYQAQLTEDWAQRLEALGLGDE
jgi:S-disulfanyl-L-cysteine oxidoreductase SoxD